MCLCVILISDLLPIVTQMLCIWIASKGKWDSLISGFLHKPRDDDRSTYAGSCMLDTLRNELARDLQSVDDFNFLTSLEGENRAGYVAFGSKDERGIRLSDSSFEQTGYFMSPAALNSQIKSGIITQHSSMVKSVKPRSRSFNADDLLTSSSRRSKISSEDD